MNRSTLPDDPPKINRRKVTLESANGVIECRQAAILQIEALGENIEPYMLDDSPDVRTIGRRCRKYGWGFHWWPYSVEPYFTSPEGKEVGLISIGDCPYLADTWNAENAPDVAGAPSLAGPLVKVGGSAKTKSSTGSGRRSSSRCDPNS